MQHSVIMGGEPFGLGLEEKLLPQFLKELGYVTHAVGKVQIWIILIYHKSIGLVHVLSDEYYDTACNEKLGKIRQWVAWLLE